MAYSPYYAPYQPAYQQFPTPAMPANMPTVPGMQTSQQQTQQVPQSSTGFAWVNSEEEAKNWVVLPGQSMMLMSRNDPVFWMKSTDQNGMPLNMKTFTYSAHNPTSTQQQNAVQYVSMDDFNALVARVDALTPPKKTEKKVSTNAD